MWEWQCDGSASCKCVSWVERKQIAGRISAAQSLLRLSEVVKQLLSGSIFRCPFFTFWSLFFSLFPTTLLGWTSCSNNRWLLLQTVSGTFQFSYRNKKSLYESFCTLQQFLKFPPKWRRTTLAQGCSAWFPFHWHLSLHARILDLHWLMNNSFSPKHTQTTGSVSPATSSAHSRQPVAIVLLSATVSVHSHFDEDVQSQTFSKLAFV